jgi:hypothetical protein
MEAAPYVHCTRVVSPPEAATESRAQLPTTYAPTCRLGGAPLAQVGHTESLGLVLVREIAGSKLEIAVPIPTSRHPPLASHMRGVSQRHAGQSRGRVVFKSSGEAWARPFGRGVLCLVQ